LRGRGLEGPQLVRMWLGRDTTNEHQGDGPLPEELETRWAELVAAVAAEFEAHQQGRPEFDHALGGLRLRARRRGHGSIEDWFEVVVLPAELLSRPVGQLAREFYQGYYACT
jgi:hypothetical protein